MRLVHVDALSESIVSVLLLDKIAQHARVSKGHECGEHAQHQHDNVEVRSRTRVPSDVDNAHDDEAGQENKTTEPTHQKAAIILAALS